MVAGAVDSGQVEAQPGPGSHTGGVLSRVAAVIGLILRGVFGAILVLRHPRPIHARGIVLEGRVMWMPGARESGIAWIDRPPAESAPVMARLSRSIGLPPGLPDVIGLALRLEPDGRPADVELASTGIGVPGRFVLAPHRSPSRATLGTLLPYRTPRGPVLICARTVSAQTLPADLDGLRRSLQSESWTLRLFFATPAGKWHPFAEMTLRAASDQNDGGLRFDAVRRPLPGADSYAWAGRVRQPSYRLAQRDAG